MGRAQGLLFASYHNSWRSGVYNLVWHPIHQPPRNMGCTIWKPQFSLVQPLLRVVWIGGIRNYSTTRAIIYRGNIEVRLHCKVDTSKYINRISIYFTIACNIQQVNTSISSGTRLIIDWRTWGIPCKTAPIETPIFHGVIISSGPHWPGISWKYQKISLTQATSIFIEAASKWDCIIKPLLSISYVDKYIMQQVNA
jgi:hypothetical protein